MEWIVTVMEIKENNKPCFKVTRRIPELKVAETKIFESEKEAKKQFNEWLK